MSSARSLLPHMRGVLACERELAELRFTWRLIETTARMVCPVEAKTILPAMAGTREAPSHSLNPSLSTLWQRRTSTG